MDNQEFELLQSIATGVKELKVHLSGMESDMKDIKVRLTNVENDVKDMKDNMEDMKVRLTNVESDVENIRHSVAVIENEHGLKLRVLYDGYLLHKEKLEKYAIIENRVEKLEIDMSAVRMTLKNINKKIKSGE